MPNVLHTQSVILYAEAAQPKVNNTQVVVLFGEVRQSVIDLTQSVYLTLEIKDYDLRDSQVVVEIGESAWSKPRDSQVVVEIGVGTWSTTTTTTTTTTLAPYYVEDVVIGPPTTTTTTTTSTTEPPFVGSTTTTTTTSTTEPPPVVSTTTTTTTSTTAPPPFDGLEWGEETPYDNVDIHPWRDLWQGEDGSTIMTAPAWETVGGTLGRSRFGQLILYPGIVDVSDVKELPEGWKTLTVEKNRYGSSYAGYVNVWIRGSTSTFSWDDGSPSWGLYTSPVYTDWTYAQLKVAMSLTGTTTSTT